MKITNRVQLAVFAALAVTVLLLGGPHHVGRPRNAEGASPESAGSRTTGDAYYPAMGVSDRSATSEFRAASNMASDADADGIADVDDRCPLRAEDIDGEADLDGCPETDLAMTVEKEHSLTVTIGEPSRFTVTTTATNGNYELLNPDGVTFLELLKSEVTDPNDRCQASWIVQSGDQAIDDLIWEDWAYTGFTDSNGNTMADEGEPGVERVLHSFLQVTFTDIPVFSDAVKVREYEVHCNTNAGRQIFLEEGIIPTYPIWDPNVQNNVHKQYIDIAVEPALTPTPTPSPAPDSDGDGFGDASEAYMGTDPLQACAATSGINDENPDPAPSDADDDRNSDVRDIIILFLGKIFNPPAYSSRSDPDMDGNNDVGDITALFQGKLMTNCN